MCSFSIFLLIQPKQETHRLLFLSWYVFVLWFVSIAADFALVFKYFVKTSVLPDLVRETNNQIYRNKLQKVTWLSLVICKYIYRKTQSDL